MYIFLVIYLKYVMVTLEKWTRVPGRKSYQGFYKGYTVEPYHPHYPGQFRNQLYLDFKKGRLNIEHFF